MKRRIRKRRTLRKSARAGPVRRGGTPAARERRERPVLIGGMHDPAEKNADRAAAQALAGGPVTATAATGGAVHRECAECEEEKEAKRSPGAAATLAAGTASARAGGDASTAINTMGTGRPLDRVERSYFEPRFGKDFSGVRVHEGAAADKAARAIDARAFARGSDIAFAAGEREKGGARLMAHELAHVAMDDGGGARRAVRRATLATADHSDLYKKVPDDHKKEVEAALRIVERAIKAKKCEDFFKDHCKDGAAETARTVFDSATIYYSTPDSDTFGAALVRASDADPRRIRYNQRAFRIGRWELAATFIHEFFHTCDFTRDDLREFRAEAATEACAFYAPWIISAAPKNVKVGDTVTISGFQFGQQQDADHVVEMGGKTIGAYDKWEQAAGASSVTIEFKVPAEVNATGARVTDLATHVVNHGVKSNVKKLNVDP